MKTIKSDYTQTIVKHHTLSFSAQDIQEIILAFNICYADGASAGKIVSVDDVCAALNGHDRSVDVTAGSRESLRYFMHKVLQDKTLATLEEDVDISVDGEDLVIDDAD